MPMGFPIDALPLRSSGALRPGVSRHDEASRRGDRPVCSCSPFPAPRAGWEADGAAGRGVGMGAGAGDGCGATPSLHQAPPIRGL